MEQPYYCQLCPRNCHALRTEQDGKGFCRMGTLPRIARAEPHFGEEPCISGERGSGTIFFSGCVLSCLFCQNDEISRKGRGRTVPVQELTGFIRRLEEKNVHNINLVSPTPYVEAILESFRQYRPKVPVVWNTGGYEKTETLQRLEGWVDIYLPDLKYISPELSAAYSGAGDYVTYALPAIHEMVRQTGKPRFDDNGMMLSGTVVRHLILPGHTKNSIAVLECLAKEFGDSILVSLMGQYVPFGRAITHPPLDRTITRREYQLQHYIDLGLDGFVQELSSAVTDFIPDWNLI